MISDTEFINSNMEIVSNDLILSKLNINPPMCEKFTEYLAKTDKYEYNADNNKLVPIDIMNDGSDFNSSMTLINKWLKKNGYALNGRIMIINKKLDHFLMVTMTYGIKSSRNRFIK
jgi:hypothetical protein